VSGKLGENARSPADRRGIRCASMPSVGDTELADLRVLTADCERPVK
jgi:hypothetical protein